MLLQELEAGFDLRKWVTNNSALQKYFNQRENLLSKNHSPEEKDDYTFFESQIKFVRNDLKRVLGVEWDTQNDEFVFHFSNLVDLARSLETTKRNVLKISASFYDPLGLISPVTARVKTIFQLLCKDKLDWDEKVPLEIEVIWEKFLSNLENWNCLKVKRFAFYEMENILTVNLHGFLRQLQSNLLCCRLFTYRNHVWHSCKSFSF